jgi:hypothetical protein
MTDLDQTTLRLRAALDELVEGVPVTTPGRAPGPSPVSAVSAVSDPPRRRGRPSVVSMSIAGVAAVLVIAAAVYVGPRSTAPTHVVKKSAGHVRAADMPPAPPGWVNLPLLLPAADVTIDGMDVSTGPVPVPSAVSSGTYAQAYEGPGDTNPARLLITTVLAQPGATSGYANGSQSVTVGGATAYLTAGGDHQIVWQTSDDVVVSLESADMTAADVVAAAQLVEPRPAAQLGVELSGPLPDGLAPVGEGFAGGDTTATEGNTVMFSTGSCHAYYQEWAGSPADFEGVAIVSSSTRVTTVLGDRAQLDDIDGDTMALLWSVQPGIDVRVQGTSGCDLTGLAAGLRPVDPSTWSSEISALGSAARTFTPETPTSSPTLPGAGTFGLAH